MELNIPLAFNPSHISQELLDTFPFDAVRYLLVNETEAYEITHHTAPEKVAKSLLEKYPSIRLVMTLGGDGAYYADREQVIRQDAFPVEAVDTTGAGVYWNLFGTYRPGLGLWQGPVLWMCCSGDRSNQIRCCSGDPVYGTDRRFPFPEMRLYMISL